ncbi:eCIS core domain-containing protein [Saccharicrinis sp. GN24d3]|uniref:eCIS core domain-containing protein n=1 Tax=Saccharicrinis sp. GN24d3 TaxID=3458416 RepID=UPI0040359426
MFTSKNNIAESSKSSGNNFSTSFIQPKLKVGQPGDKFEVEADSVADNMVEGNTKTDNFLNSSFFPSPESNSSQLQSLPENNPEELEEIQEKELGESEAIQLNVDDDILQGKCEECEKEEKLLQTKSSGDSEVKQDIEAQLTNSKGGLPLDSSIQQEMGTDFGADFSEVKIHTDSEAVQMSQELNAQAFTVGNDIYFNEGRYNPESKGGKHLLAHELTHTIQQNHSAVQRKCDCINEELTGSSDLLVQKVDDEATEAPQNTEPPLDVNDTLPSECGDIDALGQSQIEDFLSTFHQEISTWEDWRNQVNWDNATVSGQIPSISPLLGAFDSLYNTDFYCTESMILVIPSDHTEIRRMLDEGTGLQSGISLQEFDLINEWMQYDQNTSNTFQNYFQLNPGDEVEHHYTINVIVAVGKTDDIAAAGAGFGGAMETPVGKVKIGCFLKVGVGGGYVVFRYANNLGMTWEQGYLQVNVGLSGECSVGASIGPSVDTSFGSEDLCSGSADPDPTPDWYGPKDFAGGTVEQSFGVSGGLGLTADVSAAYLYLVIPGKPDIFFNTSGACFGLEIGGHMNLPAINIIQGGGQFAVGGFEGTPGDLEPSVGICDNSDLEQVREALITRMLYFETGESDVHTGEHASNNGVALNEILSAVSGNLDNTFLSSITISVVGHASPLWTGASEERAALENLNLALTRAQNTSLLLYDGLNAFDGELPPISIISDGVCEEGTPASEVDFEEESRGSEEGLEQTEDPENDWQRYRKVEITVYVTRFVDNSLTMLADQVNPENNFCQ